MLCEKYDAELLVELMRKKLLYKMLRAQNSAVGVNNIALCHSKRCMHLVPILSPVQRSSDDTFFTSFKKTWSMAMLATPFFSLLPVNFQTFYYNYAVWFVLIF